MEEAYFGHCMKNHALALGRIVLDGCGEFLAPLHSPDSLVCSVCGCHRNFHKKTLYVCLSERPEPPAVAQQVVYPLQPVVPQVQPEVSLIKRKNERKKVSDERGTHNAVVLALPAANAPPLVMKHDVERLKRFYVKKKPRTLFKDVQMERMWAFAEDLGWKMDEERSAEINDFCREIMVPRDIFKVWLQYHKPHFETRMASMAALAVE